MTAARKTKENGAHVVKEPLPSKGIPPVSSSKSTVVPSPAGAKVKKVISRTIVKKRKGDNFWINTGVVLFISVCLIAIGWDVLLQIV